MWYCINYLSESTIDFLIRSKYQDLKALQIIHVRRLAHIKISNMVTNKCEKKNKTQKLMATQLHKFYNRSWWSYHSKQCCLAIVLNFLKIKLKRIKFQYMIKRKLQRHYVSGLLWLIQTYQLPKCSNTKLSWFLKTMYDQLILSVCKSKATQEWKNMKRIFIVTGVRGYSKLNKT